MATMETWVLVLWILAGAPGPPKPKAITYPTEATCERGFADSKSSAKVVVVGRSRCVKIIAVEAK